MTANDRRQKPVPVRPTEAEFLNTEGAAVFTGLSVKTLTTWRSRNRRQGPPYFKVGRAVRYRVRDLRTFVESSPRNSTG